MLSIGVSGHRFLSEVDKLTSGIDQSLTYLEEIYGESSFRVISSLAEGSDRLAVQRVLKRPGAQLVVPLPVPQEDYLSDFKSPESKKEFLELLFQANKVINLPPTATRQEAYAAVGTYVLEHCDVLMVVWDGQEAQGIGGTGEVAAAARHIKKPTAWIMAGNRKPGTEEPTTFGEDQGKVFYENFPN
ncbi:MAG: hypothetical protein MUO54_07340 [Anaerolineales bacterium]|nr:hypothetical protein [Anaerolineales bacterium]